MLEEPQPHVSLVHQEAATVNGPGVEYSSEACCLKASRRLQTYYQPWNVNQHLGIYDQLTKEGVRFFHLKFCDLVNANDKMGVVAKA